jgi:hypothetical protein
MPRYQSIVVKRETEMAKAAASIDIPVSPDEIWELMGGFGSLRDWMPYIPGLELIEGGRVRRFTTPDHSGFTERLLTFDQVGRSYSYTIIKSPIPVTDYLSTLRVGSINGGKGSHVAWTGEFMPKGVSDDQVVAIFRDIYEGGLASLGEQFRAGALKIGLG